MGLLVWRFHEPREELLVRDERLPLGEVQVHVRELLRGGAPRHPHGRIARQEDHHLVVDARDEAEGEDVPLAREVALEHHVAEGRVRVKLHLFIPGSHQVVHDARRRQGGVPRVAEPLVRRDALDDARGISDAAVGARVRRWRTVAIFIVLAALARAGVAVAEFVVLVVQKTVHVALDVEVVVEILREGVGIVVMVMVMIAVEPAVRLGVVREDGVAVRSARARRVVAREIVLAGHCSRGTTPAEPDRAGRSRPVVQCGAAPGAITPMKQAGFPLGAVYAPFDRLMTQ